MGGRQSGPNRDAAWKLGLYLNGPGAYPDAPLIESINMLATVGFRSVDISASMGRRIPRSETFTVRRRRALRQQTRRLGMEVGAIVTHLGLADTIRAGAPLDLFGAVDVAHDTGSGLVLVHIGTGAGPTDPVWPSAVAAARAAANHALPAGVTLCLDAVAPDFLTRSPAEVDRFLGEIDRPNVGWNYDPGFIASCGYSPADVRRYLGPWIRHVHVKDFVGRYPATEWLIPGEGRLGKGTWVELLRDIRFGGAVVAEVIARRPGEIEERWSLREAASASFAWLASLTSGHQVRGAISPAPTSDSGR